VLSKILLLEDDLLFGETLVDLLEDDGFEVNHCPNGQKALEATFSSKFDAYLLDINVPLIDGVSLLEELRGADDNTPAIFLTSHKSKDMLKNGFLSGADDYLTKPFDSDELLLRLKALLKRSKKTEPESIGKLSHNKLHKTISYDGNALDLSKKEYDLLALFMSNINANVTKELICEELWSSSQNSSDGAIRVYISRLKQLLPQMKIENIRGIGYKLVS
jgi:DNA-binding response OmpR family regulator